MWELFSRSPKNLEKIQPYIVPPWWEPSKTHVASTKLQAKSEHVESLKILVPQLLRIYTDGSGINGKNRGLSNVQSKSHERIHREVRAVHSMLRRAIWDLDGHVVDSNNY